MSVEVISVHFPKAAGSSLKKSFLAAYGQEGVCFDYEDDPKDPICQYNIDPGGCREKASKISERPGIKVIHGHFHPSKYDQIKNVKRITFLRHPIDNLISTYFFWKKLEVPGHALFNYFRDNHLTLIELAKLPSIRYLMSRTYFGNFDMKSFDFIGFQENYSEDIELLSKMLSVPIDLNKENVNTFANYDDEVEAIKTNKQFMEILRNCLSEDIMFYENIKGIRRAKNCNSEIVRNRNVVVTGRNQTLEALTMQVTEKELSVQMLKAQVAEKEQSVQALTAQVEEKEQAVQALETQVEEKEQAVQALETQVEEKKQAMQVLSAHVMEKDRAVQVLMAQVAEKNQALNQANQQEELFHSALKDVVNSKAWKMVLVLQKIRQWLLPAHSFRVRVVRLVLAIIRKVAGKFGSAALFLNKSFHYVQKNGVKESILTIKHRAKRESSIIKPDSSTLIPLQNILDHLNLSLRSEHLLTSLNNVLGRERTGRVLANIVDVEKFMFARDNGKTYPLIHVSHLPRSLPQGRKKNILFITAEFPNPHHGGGNRVLNIIKTLSADNNIYLCAAFSVKEHEQLLPGLASYCREILKIPYGRFGGNQDEIRNWLGATTIDIAHYEWPRSLENYAHDFGKIQIFTFMEAVSLRLLMDMERISPLSAIWLEKLEQLAFALWLEFVQASNLDARIAVTEKDANFFRNLYPFQEYAVLNHGLDFDEFALPEVEAEPYTLVFVGNYLHYPNAEAMEFFFNEIWENIRKEIADVRIYVVGTNPTDNLLRRSDGEHIIITGTVTDVRPYIQKASVCIAPLISGAGLRGKVIEYAALHRPFVATSIASTDLVLKDGIDYFCADTALDFSDKIITLLRNPQLAREMAESAHMTARKNYDNQRLTGFLLSFYEYLENSSHVK